MKIKIKVFTYLDVVDQFIEFYRIKINFKLTDDDKIQAKEWITEVPKEIFECLKNVEYLFLN